MPHTPEPNVQRLIADREALLRILEDHERRTGFVPDPTATAQKAREIMLADGVRSEENAFSRELMAMREE